MIRALENKLEVSIEVLSVLLISDSALIVSLDFESKISHANKYLFRSIAF